jgi:uncharacterized membrane protein
MNTETNKEDTINTNNQTDMNQDQPQAANENQKASTDSSVGLENNVAGLLCYLFGLITGIIFFIIEKKSRFIQFHAMQSMITFGIIFIASIVLTAIPIIGWLVGILLTPFTIILWILLMVKAYKGEFYRLPIIGDMAEKQIDKL